MYCEKYFYGSHELSWWWELNQDAPVTIITFGLLITRVGWIILIFDFFFPLLRY